MLLKNSVIDQIKENLFSSSNNADEKKTLLQEIEFELNDDLMHSNPDLQTSLPVFQNKKISMHDLAKEINQEIMSGGGGVKGATGSKISFGGGAKASSKAVSKAAGVRKSLGGNKNKK